MVTSVLVPVVLLDTEKTQAGTPSVVAVGNVTVFATDSLWLTRLLQSVDRIVSVDVVPVTSRLLTPAGENTGAWATPPLGVEVRVCGTPFGVVGPASLAGAGVAFS